MKTGRRVLLLLLLLAAVALAATTVTLTTLFSAAMDEQRGLLAEIARSQARLIEAVARFDAVYSSNFPTGTTDATLSQIRTAHTNHRGFGRTGEFTLARRDGDLIQFLLSPRHADRPEALTLRWGTELGEPMHAALSGQSRTLIGMDYRGVRVLAATEPIAATGWGLVAKIDLAELRAPFIRAGVLALVSTLLLAVLGAVLFFALTNPLLRRVTESEARFRAIFTHAPLGIALVDESGRPRLSNPALQRLLGRDAATLAALPFPEFTHPGDIDNDLGRYQALWAGEIPAYSMEKRYLRPDGSLVWGELTVSLIRNDTGRVLGAVGMVEDIGEEVRTKASLQAKQAELEQALRDLETAYDKALQAEKLSALGTFVGGIAHEIKNPLMGLDNYIEHVQMGLDEPEQRELLAKARHQVERIGRIVDGVLTYASGGLREPERFHLAALIDSAASLLASEVTRYGIALTVTGADDAQPLITDRGVLEQALLNLLLNAIHAVRERDERHIDVSVTDDAERVAIAVSDSGPGVPAALRRRIFDPFFTTKPPGEGTGLGLSVALRTLSEIGATLSLDNGYRHGARFVITIDRLAPADSLADDGSSA